MHETPRVPTSTPLDAWTAMLAQPTGAPGGGAASAVMLALCAALCRMVAEYTPADERAAASSARLADLRTKALTAAEADGIRSAQFGAALALSTEDPTRDDLVRDAAIAASRSSAVLGDVGRDLLDELRLLAEIGAPQLRMDLAVAAEALSAGLGGAGVNLRSNLQTARRHDASHSDLTELRAEARRLAQYRLAADEIAQESASRFEE